MILIDEMGNRYGRLTVFDRVEGRWSCRCDCGTVKLVDGHNLRSGNTVSCGCFHREQLVISGGELNRTHGLSRHPLYDTWNKIRGRCLRPNHPDYADYGGRGIGICDEWREDFARFLADVGERPAGLSIDRIDNDRGYELGNVRWATPKQQSNNRRNRFSALTARVAELERQLCECRDGVTK